VYVKRKNVNLGYYAVLVQQITLPERSYWSRNKVCQSKDDLCSVLDSACENFHGSSLLVARRSKITTKSLSLVSVVQGEGLSFEELGDRPYRSGTPSIERNR
jgi:hypothetical protein